MINKSQINELKKLDSRPYLENHIIENLGLIFEKSVLNLAQNKIAIGFSGGVDSSSIAFILNKNKIPFTLYNVGYSNSKDYISANKTAALENWDLINICLDNLDIEKLAKDVIRITNKNDPITVGVGIVTLLVAKNSKEEFILTGLGSEEIFAGYERHKINTQQECWNGLENIWIKDIERDMKICLEFNKKIKFPFLEKELVSYSMQINPSLKIGDYKKQIFREAMFHSGLPHYIAFRKKSAAQYGSKVDHAINKLAKKNGLQKKIYLQKLIKT